MKNIRNFVIIAHIDSGKSTLADRMLEVTGTVPAHKMKPQYLDKMELERERGITIKMAPVRMLYAPQINAERTQKDAEEFLYPDLTYKIRGAVFSVKKNLGLGHKEVVYQRALEEEFKKTGLVFEREKALDVIYDGKKVGIYQPDFIVDNKVLVELKALPEIARPQTEQLWSYLKGSDYKLALLVNFGSKELEIKRVVYDTARLQRSSAQVEQYVLNLIDTPGHSDFSYEVSRALAAVEGAVLLVDGTKGIQAQTLSNLRAAKKAGLKIIGAVNKIDLNLPNIDKVIGAAAALLGVPEEEIFRISAKTGDGVREILDAVVENVPPPKVDNTEASRALVFDSLYDDHKGIIAFGRVFNGELSLGGDMKFLATNAKFKAKEIGFFAPELKSVEKLSDGEIGYIATGIKEPEKVRVGDTIVINQISRTDSQEVALAGYREPAPVVFISFYPDGKTKFEELKKGLDRLRLSDPALNIEPEANEALGRGLKVGFLGQLHFDIISSRLSREFNLEFLTSFPTIAYRVEEKGIQRIINQPQDFPNNPDKVWQPMIKIEILAPQSYMSGVGGLKNVFDLEILSVETLGESVIIEGKMPLAELIRDFDDKLKSVSSGYASFGYELTDEELAKVEKLEVLIVGDIVPALTRIVSSKDVEKEARQTVERLKELLPKQQFTQAIQASSRGKIIARETIPAMKKLLGNFGKTGGDRTRKMKLWKKQARGKERLQEMARVDIPPEVFREILKK